MNLKWRWIVTMEDIVNRLKVLVGKCPGGFAIAAYADWMAWHPEGERCPCAYVRGHLDWCIRCREEVRSLMVMLRDVHRTFDIGEGEMK